MGLVKVKDYDHLRKDMSTGAVVNVDSNAYTQFRLAKAKALEQARKVEQQEQRINNIEKDVKEIKDLLLKLAGKINASQ